MSADWKAFLQTLEADTRRGTLDPYEVWLEFRRHARQSASSDALMHLIAATDPLPGSHRVNVALSVASLLASAEWSPAAEQARHKTALALRGLAHKLDLRRTDSLTYLLRDQHYVVPPALWRVGLEAASELLSGPARPDQLVAIAQVCNVNLSVCLNLLKAALAEAAPRLPQELADARTAFLYAFEQYNTAARELNSAVGLACFRDLSPPLR